MSKKRKLINARNITIISVSIIITIVGIVLSFIFDLYGYIGTVGGVIINALIFFGAFGALEIDDWTIWYKRLLIKKFNGKSGRLEIKVYDNNLAKTYLSVEARVFGYIINNNQDPIFNLTIYKDETSFFVLPVTFNYITNGVTIVDMANDSYKVGKLQYSTLRSSSINHELNSEFTNLIMELGDAMGEEIPFNLLTDTARVSTLCDKMDEFRCWLGKLGDGSYKSFNPDSLTFNIEK